MKSPPSYTPSNTMNNNNNSNSINQCIQNIPIEGNVVGADDNGLQQKHSSSILQQQQQQHLVMNQTATNFTANSTQQQQLFHQQQQQQQYSTQMRDANGYFDNTPRGGVHFTRHPLIPPTPPSSSTDFYNYDSPSPIPTNQMYGVMTNGFYSKPSAYRHPSFVMNSHQNSTDPNYFSNSSSRLS